jgi:hypothetical protein
MATSVGKVIRVPDPTSALIAPAPSPAKQIKTIWMGDTKEKP